MGLNSYYYDGLQQKMRVGIINELECTLLLQYPMSLCQGPKDPVLPSLVSMLNGQKCYPGTYCISALKATKILKILYSKRGEGSLSLLILTFRQFILLEIHS